MKISPKIYAKTLVETESNSDLKKISRNFWHILQKNKQYKDLPKILDLIDSEAAQKENKKLVKIYSKNALSQTDLDSVREKLEKKLNSVIILKNICGKNITGIIAKMDDQYIDLTLEDKVKRIKKVISGN